MLPARIADLVAPFLQVPLSERQLSQLCSYLELLLRWNARINLTAVRDPEAIVQRHFGESLFTAAHLFTPGQQQGNLVDVGSGAGFPGLPIKIFVPELQVTLIESQNRKATFLREVTRSLHLPDVTVFSDRAERFPAPPPPLTVTLRAVERFDAVLPTAASLLTNSQTHSSKLGPRNSQLFRLALLIGASQVSRAHELLPDFAWHGPVPIPLSDSRVLLVASPAVGR